MQGSRITSEHPVMEGNTCHLRTSQSTGHEVNKPSYSNVATQLLCPLCNGLHRLFKCEKFIRTQAKQRRGQAK